MTRNGIDLVFRACISIVIVFISLDWDSLDRPLWLLTVSIFLCSYVPMIQLTKALIWLKLVMVEMSSAIIENYGSQNSSIMATMALHIFYFVAYESHDQSLCSC